LFGKFVISFFSYYSVNQRLIRNSVITLLVTFVSGYLIIIVVITFNLFRLNTWSLLQGTRSPWNAWRLKMRAPRSFETSATARPKTHVTTANYLLEVSTLHVCQLLLVMVKQSLGFQRYALLLISV